MTMELLSTSVPTGLEPGTSGFCTVAMSRDIPRPLIQQLEPLSGYRALFLPGTAQAALNPVAVSHLRLSAAGRTYNVLSRVCFAGADYTGRSNRFAHHVVLDTNDQRPPGGPGWVVQQPGFLLPVWDGQIRLIDHPRRMPFGPDIPVACPTWQKLTGDPSWAGVLAAAMAQDASRPFHLVYEPGMDALALISEALSVLPADRRWGVTFTTYYQGVPGNVQCQIRAVPSNAPEAKTLPPGSVLDMRSLIGKQPTLSEWVTAARTGQRPMARPAGLAMPLGLPANLSARLQQPAAVLPGQAMAGAGMTAVAESPPPPPGSAFDLATEDVPVQTKPRGGALGMILAATVAMTVLVAGVGGVAFLLLGRGNGEGEAGEGDNGKPGEVVVADKAGGSVTKPGGTPRVENSPYHVGKLRILDLPAEVALNTPLTFKVGTPELKRGQEKFPWDKLKFALGKEPVEVKSAGAGKFNLPEFKKRGKQVLTVALEDGGRYEKAEPAIAELRVLGKKVEGLKADLVQDKVRVGQPAQVKVTLPAGVAMENVTLERFANEAGWKSVKEVKPAEKDPTLLTVERRFSPGQHKFRVVFPGNQELEPIEGPEMTLNVERLKPVVTLSKQPTRLDVSKGRAEVELDIKVEGGTLPDGMMAKLVSSKDGELDARKIERGPTLLKAKKRLTVGEHKLTLKVEGGGGDMEKIGEQQLTGGEEWRVVPTARMAVDLKTGGIRWVNDEIPQELNLEFGKTYFVEVRLPSQPEAHTKIGGTLATSSTYDEKNNLSYASVLWSGKAQGLKYEALTLLTAEIRQRKVKKKDGKKGETEGRVSLVIKPNDRILVQLSTKDNVANATKYLDGAVIEIFEAGEVAVPVKDPATKSASEKDKDKGKEKGKDKEKPAEVKTKIAVRKLDPHHIPLLRIALNTGARPDAGDPDY